jgi:SAM-dependent methyltransferase
LRHHDFLEKDLTMHEERNADQKKFWDGPTGEKWVTHQADMDRNLADANAGVLKLAAAKPGERVLDIGCGAGQTSGLLAQAVGAAGHVTGVDISSQLLDAARSHAPKNAQFIHADAAFYPFKPEYDLIFSRFGVMFFDDPAEAFANIHKAAKPGGRLAFVCWRPVPENQWVIVPAMAAQPFLPPSPAPDPIAPGPFAFADPKRVEGILTKAGFKNVRIEKLDGHMHLGNSAEAAALQMTNLGPLSRAMNEVDDEAVRGKIRAAVTKAFEGLRKDGEVSPAIGCWLVSASA